MHNFTYPEYGPQNLYENGLIEMQQMFVSHLWSIDFFITLLKTVLSIVFGLLMIVINSLGDFRVCVWKVDLLVAGVGVDVVVQHISG